MTAPLLQTRSKDMERWLQGFLRTHSLDAALRHAREQRTLDPDAKPFWDYVVDYVGFLKSTEGNVVDSRELRLASRRKNLRAKAMVPWYVEAGRPGTMGGRTSQSLYNYKLAEELAKRWSVQYGVATIRQADNEDTIVGQAVDGKITAGPRVKNPGGRLRRRVVQRRTRAQAEALADRLIKEGFGVSLLAPSEHATMWRVVVLYNDGEQSRLPLGSQDGPLTSNPVRRGGRGRFVHVRKVSPAKFVRTVKTNGGRVIVGHQKGERRRTTAGRRRLTVQAVLTPKRRGRTVQRRRNPVLGILGNPPGQDAAHLGKVTYIEYTHGADGKKYFHDFTPAVNATVLKDGRVVLWHPTHRLWKAF